MYSPGYNIYLHGNANTNKGQVRKNNEDSVKLWPGKHSVLAVVADGMGGAAAGEEASRLAIETITETMSSDGYDSPDDYNGVDLDLLADKLRTTVIQANMNIFQRAADTPEFKGMGTTLTMVFARNNDMVLAHVGDSRAYLVNGHNGDIVQLTADHSFVQALVDAGHITPDEAEEHPMKNVLYRALGQGNDIEVDIHLDTQLDIGDRLILCSDGLTLHVKAYEIADVAMEETDPEKCSQRLIDLANSRGGRDNISVVAIYAKRIDEDLEESQEMEHLAEESKLTYNFDDNTSTKMLNNTRSALENYPHVGAEDRSGVEVSHSEDEGEGHDTSTPQQ